MSLLPKPVINHRLPKGTRVQHRAVKRIVVIGLPGAGKTTFARRLAAEKGLAHIEADRLFWTDGLREAPDFREKVQAAVEGDGWIFEGHFSKVKDLVLPRADEVIWLSPPFPVVLFRYLKRSFTGPRRGGTLAWLLTRRRQAVEMFQATMREAGSSGVSTRVIRPGMIYGCHPPA
jgi:adenylate kinase family enzyme